MDEVEKLEKELQYHYDIYVEKFRNMDYVEHELEKYHKAEEERKIGRFLDRQELSCDES